MYIKYRCEFYSNNKFSAENFDSKYRLSIYKKTGTGSTTDFKCTSEGFTLSMEGSDDSMLSPIKTTSVSFNFIIEEGNTAQAGILSDLLAEATDNEGELSLLIERATSSGYKRYWIGVILGDLSAGKDTTPNRIVNIRAVDGLAQLKFKHFSQADYGGTRSCLNLIKVALLQITSSNNDFGFWNESLSSTKNFIAHTPYYYCEAMGSLDGTWKNDVNHDPLALTYINTSIYENQDGTSWSYYKILEQILAAFQLRIMMCSHRNDTASSTMEDGNAIWYLQAPLLFHNNDNDSGYDNDQIIFYHNKSITTDIALEVDVNFVCDDSNPTDRLSGTEDKFLPPLLSYQTIYKHNVFAALALGPINWNSATPLYGHNANYNYYDDTWNLDLDLTNRQNVGFTGWTNQHQDCGKQKLAVVGNVSIEPIDVVYYGANSDNGYESAAEYWANQTPFLAFTWYQVNDECMVFPRLGLEAQLRYEDSSELSGYNTAAFMLGSMRWGVLYGSVPWSNNSTFLSYESEQATPFYGFDGSSSGLQFDLTEYNAGNYTNTYVDGDGLVAWGTDLGEGGEYEAAPAIVDWMYWKEVGYDGLYPQSSINNNQFSWFSPYYFNGQSTILQFGSSTWPTTGFNYWEGVCNGGNLVQTQPFMVVSPPLPWCRKDFNDESYGWCKLHNVKMTWGVPRDKAIASDGDSYYVAGKDWNKNRNLDTADRGIQYVYSYTDVRVFVVGSTAGADSFDTSYGYFENGNGSPSEEMVQEPEILIGDEPPFDPFADNADDSNFGGEYMGMFRIYTTADPTTAPQEGATTFDWRTEAMETSGTEDMQLHHIRAKMAIAHYVRLKRKLQLRFLDRSPNKTIESCPFAQLYYWTSGDWSTNQVGTDIAFIPTGGKFVAGTGEVTLDLEDCVSYSKDGLINKSYSSNG